MKEHKKNEHVAECLDVQPASLSPKPIQLFKCDECTFFTTTNDELEEHKKGTHLVVEKVEYIRCEISQLETQDDSAITNHQDHEETLDKVKSLPLFKCDECTFMTRTVMNQNEHKAKKHSKEYE